jgi:pyruvate dehydrogenase E1 component
MGSTIPIALGQSGLRHYEPAFADELAAMIELAFRLIDRLARRSLRRLPPRRRGDHAGRRGFIASVSDLKSPFNHDAVEASS